MAGSLGYRVPVLDRFWAKVDRREDGCWEWTGMRVKRSVDSARLGEGYGYLWLEGKMVRAHRLSYELFVGAIPAGNLVLHSCDRPWCVNPAHLRVGTHSDNVRDCVTRRRHGNQWRKQLTQARSAEPQATGAAGPTELAHRRPVSSRAAGGATSALRTITGRRA